MGLAVSMIAVGGASVSWAVMHLWSVTSSPAGAQLAPSPWQDVQSAVSGVDDDEIELLRAEIALLSAALERVTEERDKARQELMELEDRWSW